MVLSEGKEACGAARGSSEYGLASTGGKGWCICTYMHMHMHMHMHTHMHTHMHMHMHMHW